MKKNKTIVVLILCASFFSLACAPIFSYPDAYFFDGMAPEQRAKKHTELLEQGSSCLREQCSGDLGVKARNDLKSLKCHSLNLTIGHYKSTCSTSSQQSGLTQGEPKDGKRQDNSATCHISGSDVALLYDSLFILGCR